MIFKILSLLSIYFLFSIILKRRYHWDIFTRIISTVNAIQCICMTFYTFLNWDKQIFDLYYIGNEYQLQSLFWFSSYLFVDGVFQLSDKWDLNLISSLFHHFVGSFGIYLIAKTKMGFFLGLYFSMTEISTPFLNLSWLFRKNFLFFIFHFLFTISRIATFSLPLFYLRVNENKLLNLIPLYYQMAHYGTYLLISLNFLWFSFLVNKVRKMISCKKN
jgi:TLC domain